MASLNERYGAALFDIALEKDSPEKQLEQAVLLRDILSREDSKGFLIHPHIPDSDKHKFVNNLFKGRISSHLLGFLYLSIDKNREGLIVPALSAYIDRLNEHLGRVEASVVSASSFSEAQLERLSSVLSKKLDKQVKISHRVDPALLGGFYVYVDGRLIDRTVKTQLINMRETIIRGSAE